MGKPQKHYLSRNVHYKLMNIVQSARSKSLFGFKWLDCTDDIEPRFLACRAVASVAWHNLSSVRSLRCDSQAHNCTAAAAWLLRYIAIAKGLYCTRFFLGYDFNQLDCSAHQAALHRHARWCQEKWVISLFSARCSSNARRTLLCKVPCFFSFCKKY